jgi:hypothetical protein
MSTHPASFDAMFAAWNERDPSRVRGHLEQALAADVLFIDPTIVTRGIDEFEHNVHDFRRKYPHAQIHRSAVVDSHHQLHRYTWQITIGSKTLLHGMDVTSTDGEGKVTQVLGFFGPPPVVAPTAT